MKIVAKMSGWSITEVKIDYIFEGQFVTLMDCMQKIKRQETMNFILDTFRFARTEAGQWVAILDYDTIAKISIMENYPEVEKELVDYFGEEWIKCYLRFEH